MRVKIGNYVNWFGPYQMADLLMHVGVSEERCGRVGDWLADTWVADFLQWVYDKRNRTVSVKIDPWDTWSMDYTLALVIHPLLIQLKNTSHGFFMVDDVDVPEDIRSTNAPTVADHEIDDNAEARHEFVMNEMIWAFGQIVKDDDSEFSKGEIDLSFSEPDVDGLSRIQYGPNHTFKTDMVAQNAYHARIANGTRLFGRYYRSLWT